MRVLHVAAYYAPAYRYGGPPRSIHGLCRALTRRGVDVEVFTTDADGPGPLPPAITERREFEGVPVRYFPRTWPLQPIGSHALGVALQDEIARFDLVHIHGLWNRVVWTTARAARRAGVPYVIAPRGMLEEGALAHQRWRKRLAYAAIERHTLDGCALFHATSPREVESVRALRPSTPVVMIPNGIDPPPAAPMPTGAPVFAFVGRIHVIKRLDLLLDAFAQVHEWSPDARLVIAGPDEQGLRAGLERRHALGDAVTWLGSVDAVQRDALLATARGVVLCSDSESFGMAVVEAMGAARPAIVARTCGWPELERRGSGLLVEQSAGAIADAMQRLAADPAGAAAMGMRGRAWVEEAFTWNAVADACVRAYASVHRPVLAGR